MMKNFIRGVGVGILVATLILSIAYMLKGKNISDQEVIQRAKKLGMVEEKQSVIKNPSDQEDNANVQNSAEPSNQGEKEQESIPPEGNLEDNVQNPEATLEGNADTETTTAPQEDTPPSTPPTEPQPGGDTTAIQQPDNTDVVQLEISPGTDGVTICRRLQEMGIIADATDFGRYLAENDMSKYIMHGTYSLKKNSSYEEVAQAIVRK